MHPRPRAPSSQRGGASMSAFVRSGIVIVGVLLMFAGLAVLVLVPGLGVFGFLQLFGGGAFLVIVEALERQRYRSGAAERQNAMPGPGGGEPVGTPLESRFRATNEVFIDPT